jgi:DNA-binding NtrC family response regulator
VTAVASAADALDEMTASPFPIVVCDVIMPVQDGIWLLAQIRQRWPQTVVLMESGAQEFHTIVKARQFGAVDFVPKPIERELLRQALQRALAALGDESGNGP